MNDSNSNWQENLALGLGVANAALEALTGGEATQPETAVVVAEEPSDWEIYGPWVAGLAAALLLALVIKD